MKQKNLNLLAVFGLIIILAACSAKQSQVRTSGPQPRHHQKAYK